MFQFPDAWTRSYGANLTTAYPGGGRFRAHERFLPQPRFATIVEHILADDGMFLVHEFGETLRLVTVEGEYAARVRIDGIRDGRAARRFVGAVFLGEYAAALDCIAIEPSRFAELERWFLELLHGARFSMGRRPRQFQYVPPPGWHALPSGLTASWYPLDYPRNATRIVIPPTYPI